MEIILFAFITLVTFQCCRFAFRVPGQNMGYMALQTCDWLVIRSPVSATLSAAISRYQPPPAAKPNQRRHSIDRLANAKAGQSTDRRLMAVRNWTVLWRCLVRRQLSRPGDIRRQPSDWPEPVRKKCLRCCSRRPWNCLQQLKVQDWGTRLSRKRPRMDGRAFE